MTMTLLDAKEYDNRRDIRRRNIAISAAIVIVILVVLYLVWPYYMAHRLVGRFMNALAHGNYQEAYAIWHPDPQSYSMDSFMKDWGPDSRWGTIKTYKIDKVMKPPPMLGISGESGTGSGLIALVTINGIADQARIYVVKYKGVRILTFYPY